MPFCSSCRVIATSLLYYEVAMSLSGFGNSAKSSLLPSSEFAEFVHGWVKLSTETTREEDDPTSKTICKKKHVCGWTRNQADYLFVVMVILLAKLVYVRQ